MGTIRSRAMVPTTSKADPELLAALGATVLQGMKRCADCDQFVDTNAIKNTYMTHFPMPDGHIWELTVSRRRDASA